MGLSFRTFRRSFLGFIIAVSAVCFCLLATVGLHVHSTGGFLVLAVLLFTAISGYFWSICWKVIQKKPLMVGVEILASLLFNLLELAIVVTAASIMPNDEKQVSVVKLCLALRLLVYVNAGLCTIYSISLLLCTIIISKTVNRRIWLQDIDSSPSPFPPSIILAYFFPWYQLPTLPSMSVLYYGVPLPSAAGSYCLQGCQCTAMKHHTESTSEAVAMLSANPIDAQPDSKHRKSTSLVHSLVRIPNDVERRSTITVTFDV